MKKSGDKVVEGEIIGEVQETPLVSHKIMVPPGVSGELKELKAGSFTIREKVAAIKTPEGDVHDLPRDKVEGQDAEADREEASP